MPGTLKYSEIVDTVVINTNRSDKKDLIKKAINLAIEEISMRHRWSDLMVSTQLTAGVDDYSISGPEDLGKILRVRAVDTTSANLWNIGLIPKKQFLDLFPNREGQSTSSSVQQIAVDGSSLLLNCKVGSITTLYVDYIKKPAKLVADTDVCEIGYVDNCLIAWATRYVYQSIQELQDAQFWSAEYERSLIFAIRYDSDRPGEDLRIRLQGEISAAADDPFVWKGPDTKIGWGIGG